MLRQLRPMSALSYSTVNSSLSSAVTSHLSSKFANTKPGWSAPGTFYQLCFDKNRQSISRPISRNLFTDRRLNVATTYSANALNSKRMLGLAVSWPFAQTWRFATTNANARDQGGGSKMLALQSRGISGEELNKAKEPPPKHFMAAGNRRTTPKSDIAQIEMAWESEVTANLPHPIWSDQAVKSVKQIHYSPVGFVDTLAYASVKILRTGFDIISGYSLGFIDEGGWLNRIVFLETVAGVPGLVGAMVRHLKSLRKMERDYGWIHTLLEEAENERMHLMSALQLKRPSKMFRLFVLVTQGIFLPFFTLAYVASPRYAHRFVGYLEEEAVRTYTHLLKLLDEGKLEKFQKLDAPVIAKQYWELPEDASFQSFIAAVRADEAHHRDVNHKFSDFAADPHAPNPFAPGQ